MTVRQGLTVKRFWGLWVAGLAAVGCQCGVPAECENLKVEFIAPLAGATVETMPAVEVRGLDRDNQPFAIGAASLAVAGPGATFGTSVPGTVAADGLTATFPNVPVLTAGANQLRVTLTRAGTSCAEASQTITVNVMQARARVTSLTFPQDANGDGILNNVELPAGSRIQVRVQATSLTDADALTLVVGGTALGTGTFNSMGQATVEINRAEGDTGMVTVFAEIRRAGVAQNTQANNPEAVRSIELRRVMLSCLNDTKAVNGPSDDGDRNAAGFQLSLTGRVGGATRVRFVVDGMARAFVTPMSNGSAGDVLAITTPPPFDRTFQVSVEGEDAVGNRCSTSATPIRVDLQPPLVSITEPVADGGVVTIRTTPVDVVATIAGAPAGAMAKLQRRVVGTMAWSDVTTGTIAGGTVRLPVSFADRMGDFDFRVEVTDENGNVGFAELLGAQVRLLVCGLDFEMGLCPAYVTAARLTGGVDGGVGSLFPVRFRSGDCATQPVRVFLDGALQTTTDAGQASIAVAPGLSTVRIETDNQTGEPTRASCQLFTDLGTPRIDNPGSGDINQVQDSNSSLPGAQRQVRFTASTPPWGRTDICVNSMALALTCGSAPCACPDGQAGWFQFAASVVDPIASLTFPEGSYSLKVVTVGGTTFNVSPPLAYRVDVTPPCVSDAGLVLPQDLDGGFAGDGVLNAAELAGGNPLVQFTLGCGDTPTTLSQGTRPQEVPVAVTSPNGVLTFTQPPAFSFVGNTGTVGFSLDAGDTRDTVFLQLRDQVGNINTVGVNPSAARSVAIQRTPPVCTITQPSIPLVGQAGAPGGLLATRVVTSSTVDAGVFVTMTRDGGAVGPQQATPDAGVNAWQSLFALSGTFDWTVGATCRDFAGNSTTAASVNVSVDLDAPTCSFVAPTTGASFTTNDLNVNVSVGGADGRNVEIRSSLQAMGASALGTLPVSSGTASGLVVGFPNGTQTVSASVSDPSGNTCNTSVTGVVVNSTSCSLTLTNAVSTSFGLFLNRSNTTSTGAGTGTANVNVTSSCTSASVQLRRGDSMGTLVDTQTTSAGGTATFASVSVADGETYTVIVDNGAGLLTTRTLNVDLVAPTATQVNLNGNPAPNAALFIVAPTGNVNVGTDAGFYASASASQGEVTVGVTGITGASSGQLTVLFNGATVTQQTVSGSPVDVTLGTLGFTQATTGPLVVRLSDTAGNTSDVYSQTLTVDVVAPAAPSATITTQNARTATARVVVSGCDNGGTFGGSCPALAGYDVRWTTASIPGNNGLSTSTTFFSSAAQIAGSGLVPWSASAAAQRDFDVPTMDRVFVVARSRDAVGNYSAYPTTVTTLNHVWTTLTLAPLRPDGGTYASFGNSVWASGSVNNDTVNDLVVAAPSAPDGGAVLIFFGGSSLAGQTSCSLPNCQVLNPPSQETQFFGNDLAVGDVDQDGKADILVAAPSFPTTGRAMLYFGRADAGTVDPSEAIEFRGSGSGTSFAGTARIVDVTGDGNPDVVFSAVGELSGLGRVHVFFNRNRAAWRALATVDGGPAVVTPSLADRTIEGQSPDGGAFGRFNWGWTTLPDLNSDGRPEFLVPNSKDNNAAVFAYSSAHLLDAGLTGTTGLFWSISLPGSATNTALTGFGRAADGTQNVVASTTSADLVVTRSTSNQVYIYPNLTSSIPGSATIITGPSTFGTSLAVSDLNADGERDLLVGEVTTTFRRVWLLFQRSGLFPSAMTTVGTDVLPWATEVRNPNAPSTSDFGRHIAVGDLTGDGRAELVIPDALAPTPSVFVFTSP